MSPSPALARLGLATPPPFVGRTRELAELSEALQRSQVVVVQGAVGSGKTRLAGMLAKQQELACDLRVTRVACAPGDLGIAVVTRAERALDALPGSLAALLEREKELLVIDDVHHLPPVDVSRLVDSLSARPGVGRVVLLTRDVLPLSRRDASRHTMGLEGLDESAARDLWTHLEELYGPTPAKSCDRALARTRGMPLAMRREYARARYGEHAWELEALPEAVRAALEAVAVARLPVAPAAVAALLDEKCVEACLIDLVSRQLIDPLASGRFAIHDVIRDQVIAALPDAWRKTLELRAVELIRGGGRGVGARRMAWLAGDDGAVELLDDVDRAREVIEHLLAVGDIEACETRLEEVLTTALSRGAGGEMLALLHRLRSAGGNPPRLDAMQAKIALRHGRVAEAAELGDALDPIQRLQVRYAIGEVAKARAGLRELCKSADAILRARAAAACSEVELDMQDVESCARLLEEVFAYQRDRWDAETRALMHLAFADLERRRGNHSAARAALARAASSAADVEIAARVEAKRVCLLVEEERYSEARAALVDAMARAREVDCFPVRDELEACQAQIWLRDGAAEKAASALRNLVVEVRKRGDEITALRYELQLAAAFLERDMLQAAAETVGAVLRAASALELNAMVVEARSIHAAIALRELRFDMARDELDALTGWMPFDCARRVARCRAQLDGHDTPIVDLDSAALAIVGGADKLAEARKAAIESERVGRPMVVARALAIVARMELSRGDRRAASSAAARAAREARACGIYGPRIEALLVLASIARDEGDVRAASTYALDAVELATSVGLPFERLLASRAVDVISSAGTPGAGVQTANDATLDAKAIECANRALADLGFAAARPYRCVAHDGSESFVTSATPELLGAATRDLLVDGVQQCIYRGGKCVADLRRRSLLKKLLYLFASKPGQIFSKEDIVQKVWEVEYHPLRHDAALFTNIMRIRRLLGDDGGELIRVGEEGYHLEAPRDFLFVVHSGL